MCRQLKATAAALLVPALLALLGAATLTSCSVARPAATSPVGTHDYRHDARTRHAEPYATTTPSR